MKKLTYILVGIIIVVAVLISAKNAILMFVIEKEVKSIAGIHLSMESLKVGLIDATVAIKGFKIYNPPEYPDEIMIDMPDIYIDIALSDVLKGKMHIQQLKLDVAEFMVVRNSAGELNLNTLKVVREAKGKKSKKKQTKIASGLNDIQIDFLKLKIDKVVFKDYSKGLKPDVKVFNIHIDQTFTNITDPDSLVSLLVIRALRNTRIAELTGFDLHALRGQVSGLLLPAHNIVDGAGTRAARTLAGAAGTVDRAVEGLEETLFHQASKEEDGRETGGVTNE